MALYRLIYQKLNKNTIDDDRKFKDDSTARITARNMMLDNNWQCVIIERKRKNGYFPVAKYNSVFFRLP